MVSIDVDASDALRLAGDFAKASTSLVAQTRAVVSKSANEIKTLMRADMGASSHFKEVARAISYDLSGNGSGSEAEIGPVKGSPGSLANIAYFGGANGGGGTVRDPMESANEALPAIEAALDALIEGLL